MPNCYILYLRLKSKILSFRRSEISYSTVCLNMKHRRRWHPKPLAANNFFKHTHTVSIETVFLPRKTKQKCTIWKVFSARETSNARHRFICLQRIFYEQNRCIWFWMCSMENVECVMQFEIGTTRLKYFRNSLNKIAAPLRWDARTTDELPD